MEPLCDCGRQLASENDLKHGLCFRCKVRGVSFDFSGVKDRLYGEGLTGKRIVEDARRAGIEPEPVGTRWV